MYHLPIFYDWMRERAKEDKMIETYTDIYGHKLSKRGMRILIRDMRKDIKKIAGGGE